MKLAAISLASLILFAIPAALVRGEPGDEIADKVLTTQSSTDDVLDALDQVGKGLHDFTADVKLDQTDAVANETIKQGHISYQKKTGDDVRIRVVFDKTIIGQITRNDITDYLLDKGWMIEQDSKAQKLISRQVVRPNEKINPLKLGEGPFPLPIGQDRADVLKNFKVEKVAPDKKDPDNTVHIMLTPNPGTKLARQFGSIDVWVDGKTHFPAHIETLDPHQADDVTTDLTNLKLNPGLKDGDFKQPAVKNYEEITEPLEDEPQDATPEK